MAIVKQTVIENFKVNSLENGTNWENVFSMLLKIVRSKNIPQNWKLLQEVIGRPEIEIRKTWKIEGVFENPIVFKMRKINRRCSFERWLRGLWVSSAHLLPRIEKAHDLGFLFPMKIYLVAERRERGFLREEFMIAEYIDRVENATLEGREQEVIEKVFQAHKFGLCWGGDPDPNKHGGNIILDKNNNLRGIDICPRKATWRERGKDALFFYDYGIKMPFSFGLLVARLQRSVKNFLRNN